MDAIGMKRSTLRAAFLPLHLLDSHYSEAQGTGVRSGQDYDYMTTSYREGAVSA